MVERRSSRQVEAKKLVYAKLVEECKDEEDKQTNKKIYKAAKMETKLAVTTAKTSAFE